MKRLYLLIIICSSPVVTLIAEDNKRIIEGLSLKSSILAQEVKYSVVLPADYFKGKKKYPVVYLLHGLGDDESSWLEYGRISQIADEVVKEKEMVPMIFVMPQGFRNYYVNDYASTFLYEDMFIQELVPHIDKTYRTIPDNSHRATMGYSMGGFGALLLPLKHPDIFSVSVPLSISLRTDQQYMVEDASEWNDQWGRVFGGVGTVGEERITDYYKQYSPFHLWRQLNLRDLSNLKLFIDNGDDEETLCRSNEELHILLRDLQIIHEYRVREGGHSFTYWREALPDALRYISDSFEGKRYRGDVITAPRKLSYPKLNLVQKEHYTISLPSGFDTADRHYPAVYMFGEFDIDRMQLIAGMAENGFQNGSLPPMLVVFLKEEEPNLINVIIPEIESNFGARRGFRFRALVGVEVGGVAALKNALSPEVFTSCVLFDAPVDTVLIREAIATNKSAMKRTWLLISNKDTGEDYKENGQAHILLRDEEVYHEYRVVDGGHDGPWMKSRWEEAFQFTSEKIHR